MAQSGWNSSPSELLKVGQRFVLADVDTSSTPGIRANKTAGEKILAKKGVELNDLQERLWAESRYGGTRSLLLVLQAMDTAGKGGILEHVMGAISPEGIRAYAFKKPTDEELAHDFLWRVRRQLPTPGVVGVFDRSHYEDVLIGRVRNLAEPGVIAHRYTQIKEFEQEIVANGTTIVKVMLHISEDEQGARLADRLERRDKQWKYNPGDLDERALWPQYQEAYELAVQKTSTADAPWFVVPADHKWYARIAVQRLLLDALRGMKLDWPQVDYDIEVEKARLRAG
ncbi:MAG: phosphate--nucleotide phosphotransferase [Microbacteriaceae bacterium]|nr:phosphate--nucleotide phosphotransferase [Microbacteriaceae bacterium]